jgi:hypothetical protein
LGASRVSFTTVEKKGRLRAALDITATVVYCDKYIQKERGAAHGSARGIPPQEKRQGCHAHSALLPCLGGLPASDAAHPASLMGVPGDALPGPSRILPGAAHSLSSGPLSPEADGSVSCNKGSCGDHAQRSRTDGLPTGESLGLIMTGAWASRRARAGSAEQGVCRRFISYLRLSRRWRVEPPFR